MSGTVDGISSDVKNPDILTEHWSMNTALSSLQSVSFKRSFPFPDPAFVLILEDNAALAQIGSQWF